MIKIFIHKRCAFKDPVTKALVQLDVGEYNVGQAVADFLIGKGMAKRDETAGTSQDPGTQGEQKEAPKKAAKKKKPKKDKMNIETKEQPDKD